MCTDILENGTTTEGQKVRPHWPDGTPAYTIKKFGVVTRYNLQEEFPVLTLRKTPVKSALDELLWIWQAKSSNIHDLHSGVWDEWADETGSIGKAYGYQMAVKHRYHDISEEGLRHAFGDFAIPETAFTGDVLTPELAQEGTVCREYGAARQSVYRSTCGARGERLVVHGSGGSGNL